MKIIEYAPHAAECSLCYEQTMLAILWDSAGNFAARLNPGNGFK